MREIAIRDALNEALDEEMALDDRVFLMGEEVAEYDGAYKVSRGLLDKFGPQRVVDSPISELGFAGLGVGAALVGLRPVIEMMTYNFAILAFDQFINHAAKWLYMSGGQFPCPVTFRGPGGAAHMLGAQHSQVVDSMLANVPGLKVVSVSTPYDAKGLLKSSIRDPNPVIFIESEMMYADMGPVPEETYTIPLGVGDIKREGTDVTLVGWNKSVHVALAAAAELQKVGVSAEVIDPRTIRPLDEDMIFESVKKTNRLVVVQEGWPYAGVAAEIVTRVQERCFDDLDAPVLRVTNRDVPMPYNEALEHEVLPSPERVIEAARRVLYLD